MAGRAAYNSFCHWTGLDREQAKSLMLLERIDVVSKTTTVDASGLHLNAVALAGGEASTLTVAALYVLALIAAAAGMASRMRDRERAAKRHLHLQAWQLRQLVPR